MLDSSLNHIDTSSQISSSNNSTTQDTPVQVVGYQCRHCQKVLSTKQSLREHSYTHTGQKPYVCKEPGCGQTFRQSSQLSYHKRIHSEIKKVFKGESKVIGSVSHSSPMKEEQTIHRVILPQLPEINSLDEEFSFSASFKFSSVVL